MTIGNDKAGAGARSPFAIPTEGWLAVLRRTWEETGKDNIGLIAAGIAFYAFAAIVPLLGAVVLSYGLFAEPETVRSNVEHVFAAVPREAATIITEQLVTVVETSKGKQGLGLIIAIALAFYGATKGASAIVTALNVAYGETERRGFFRVNLLYFALVAGGVFLIFLAIASTTLLGFLESLVPRASDVLLTRIRLVPSVRTNRLASSPVRNSSSTTGASRLELARQVFRHDAGQRRERRAAVPEALCLARRLGQLQFQHASGLVGRCGEPDQPHEPDVHRDAQPAVAIYAQRPALRLLAARDLLIPPVPAWCVHRPRRQFFGPGS